MAGVPAFTGIKSILDGRMTYNAHGMTPSVCTVTAPPQAISKATGTLSFRDTESGKKVYFNNCLVDSVSYQGSQPVVMVVRILDERWAWGNFQITGGYNLREADGQIKTSTKKTTQELATLLLRAIGITNFNVSNLPVGSNPEMIWDHAGAASELVQLCSSLGCRPVRELTGKVVIHRNGIGRNLPVGRNLQPDVTVDPANKPATVEIALGPTEYEYTFDLVAVAEESPGKYVPLEDVAYKPTGGWADEDPENFFGVDSEDPPPDDVPTSRQLALRSVFRAYRLDPGQEVKVNDKVITQEQILPLRSVLIDAAKSDDDQQKRKPAYAKGTHWDGRGTIENKDQMVKVQFQILPELGIVLFGEPVYKIGTGTDNEAATLQLKTTFHLTNAVTNIKDRKTFSLPVPDSLPGAGTKLIERTEINLQVKQAGTNNEQAVKLEAEYYLNAEIQSYRTVTAGSITLSGIIPFIPDGALSQVTWSCGGRVPAITVISRNNEIDPFTPSYQQRQKRIQDQQGQDQVAADYKRRRQGSTFQQGASR